MSWDWREFYPLFEDLGQGVIWEKMRPCPNWDPKRSNSTPSFAGGQTGHKRDCPICAGNLFYVEEQVVTTAILDDQQMSRKYRDAGLLEDGDAVLAISSIIHDSGSWIEHPLIKIRPDDHIIAPYKITYGKASTSKDLEYRISEIYVDSGTAITACWAAVDNSLVDYTVGTDVTLDLATRRLSWSAAEPEYGLVYVEFEKPERFVMMEELSSSRAPGVITGSEYKGPRFFRVKKADSWVRKHGAR